MIHTITDSASSACPALPLTSSYSGPLTLGQWLRTSQKNAEDLLRSTFLVSRAAQALLMDIGISRPTESQLSKTITQLSGALRSGNYESFVCPIKAPILDVEQITATPGNVFHESEVYSRQELTPQALKLTIANQRQLKRGYSNGLLGHVIAATFIGDANRCRSDFSHAYGNEPWDCYLRAWNFLGSIPHGSFIDQLNIDLVTETNRLIHAPDPRALSQVYRAIGALTRGRIDVAGRIRVGQTLTQPYTFSKEEITNLAEAGIVFYGLPNFGSAHQTGILQYPNSETIRPRIQSLIDELKQSAAQEDADLIGAAAKFCRHLIALHPYEDSNGRTARLIMNRLLEEFGYPPSIVSNSNNDLTMGPAKWRKQVIEGIAHTKRYLKRESNFANDSILYKEDICIPGIDSLNPITVSGLPFNQGRDGFLYDVTGRPYLLDGNTLKPLAQLEYYCLARRLESMPLHAANAQLMQITQTTRDMVAQLRTGRTTPPYKVASDLSARQADSDYAMRGDCFIFDTILQLTSLHCIDMVQLYRIKNPKGTAASSCMSKYTQIDLEYWQIHEALMKAQREQDASLIKAYRSELFDHAKSTIDGLKNSSMRTETNPHGFEFEFEQKMYAASPLRFADFQDAIHHDDDSMVTIWRGDYGFARLLGMAPNNDPRQSSARLHTQTQYKQLIVPHIIQDLKELERTGAGSPYLSHTSDLSLLTGKFAQKNKTAEVRLDAMPSAIAWGINKYLGNPNPNTPTLLSVGNTFGVPGEVLNVQRGPNRTLQLTASRKAFEMRVAKSSVLAGIVSLSRTHGFNNEQEIHGLEPIGPLSIVAAYDSETLKTPISAQAQLERAAVNSSPILIQEPNSEIQSAVAQLNELTTPLSQP